MSANAQSVSGADALLVDRRELPYELDEGLGTRARIGLIVLATDHTLEHEFRKIFTEVEGVAVYHSRLWNSAEINPRTLAEMEGRIGEATRVLVPNVPLDVIAYACTSGAMVIGEERVHARIREHRPGIACTTPMEAACAALGALGARRVAFLPPYLDEINRSMRRALIERGFEVPVMASWNISDDRAVARLSPKTVGEAVLEFGAHPEVDAVFVPCTSVRLAEQVEALEQRLGKPVTSSNHATAWHCLRLAGYQEPVAGFGRLFRTALPPAAAS